MLILSQYEIVPSPSPVNDEYSEIVPVDNILPTGSEFNDYLEVTVLPDVLVVAGILVSISGFWIFIKSVI